MTSIKIFMQQFFSWNVNDLNISVRGSRSNAFFIVNDERLTHKKVTSKSKKLYLSSEEIFLNDNGLNSIVVIALSKSLYQE